MSIEIKVPPLPESVADAILVAWHKKPGDSVTRDENIADLETDKVVLEVPAPASGTLVSLSVEAGATVTSGDMLAILEEGEVAAVAAAAPAKSEADQESAPIAAASQRHSTPMPLAMASRATAPAGTCHPGSTRACRHHEAPCGIRRKSGPGSPRKPRAIFRGPPVADHHNLAGDNTEDL